MPMRQKARRVLDVGNPTCLLGFSGRDSVDSAIFDTSTLSPGGVNEVQTVTITGTPTGGNFKLGYKGQSTANIAYNAAASAVQTALRALSKLGNVTVSGSAGGPYTVTFTGKLAAQDVPLLTLAANALTGGTSPSVTIAETTKGDASFANLYVLKSGTPLMASPNDANKVAIWDGASASTLVGIFDGQVDIFAADDYPVIPVYNTDCVFDKDVVLNYATWTSNYNTWAAAALCKFKSQGT